MNHAIERAFELMHQLRDGRTEHVAYRSCGLDGFIEGLFWGGLITHSQYKALAALATSAYCHSGEPFPSIANAGPVSPWFLNLERSFPLPKPQAVPVNEPVQLQPVAAPRKLLLLCLLGRSPGSKITRSFAQPVGVSRLPAPRVAASARWCVRQSNRSAKRSAVSGIWPIQNSPGLVLREAHAVAPSAEVLARLQRHGQTNALRATARTVQLGVTA